MGLNQGVGRSRRCFKEPEAAVKWSRQVERRRRSRRCFKEPEAEFRKLILGDIGHAAVAAVSKSLRREARL